MTKKPETKRLEDMSVSELALHIRSLGKVRIKKTWRRPFSEYVYPPGYQVAESIFRRKAAEENAEHKLKLDEIETKLSKNRHERAQANLSSSGLEPLPNHHCIHDEFSVLK